MRKSKISVSELQGRAAPRSASSKLSEVVRFVGISLAGGKSDKACIAVFEYFPANSKLFLSRLYEKIKVEEDISADLKIHEIINQKDPSLKYVAFDTPLNLPTCLTCQVKCPGFENCNVPHIEWMWRHHREHAKNKKPKKLFTPYTQRAVEMYFQTGLEDKFQLHHAMGSNTAPLLARALYIKKRLDCEIIEVFPALSMHRLGEGLGLMKSALKDHRAAFGGDESREKFLRAINEKNLAFIYHQDAKSMVENSHSFEAFLCGLTAFLKYKNLVEPKPKSFPPTESWIEFPVKNALAHLK